MERPGVHLAVASGKGGTGKTTIATNLAVVAQTDGHRVTYADCDVEGPNGHLFLPPDPEQRTDVAAMIPVVAEGVCNLCGVCADVCEFNALAVMGKKVLLFPSLCHSCNACITLCPERAMTEGMRSIGFVRSGPARGLFFVGGNLNVGEAQAPPLIKAVKTGLSRDGLVIIDAPPGTSCPVVESVRDADYVILVTEPTPFGFNDLRLAVSMLRELERPFGVVINRCDIGDSLLRDYCHHERVRILLEIPFDRRIAQAYSAGRLAASEDARPRQQMMSLYQAVMQEISYVRACGSQR
jgi:MinD superfamily P-loop ATPase